MSDPFFSPFIKASKKIIFFHDIIYFEKKIKRESKFFDHLHHKIMIKVSKNFSNKNICISKFTEKRVNELLGIKNTQVVYLGVEDNFKVIKEENILNKIINKYNLKKPFIFYIGSLSPRKNLVRIIKAFNTIKEKIPHNLYLFGGYSWRDKEVINLLNKTNSDNRIIRGGFVEEKDLPLIYNLADLYLYPSLYEGFGLPILEAQACGCPVLTSNVASCPEVAGKGARIVNPYLVEEISEGIMKILNDKKYKEELIKNGFKNVKRFSWEKSTKKILDLIEK
jgi:glycosyltransferase involved in cell wall biosynthesis